MKTTSPNSPKTILLVGLVFLILSFIFHRNTLLMTFGVLSGFILIISAVVKVVTKLFSKQTSPDKPSKFWPIMFILLALLFIILYFGSKSPPSKIQEIPKTETPTPTLNKEAVRQEIENRLADNQQKEETPSPTVKQTSPTVVEKPTPKVEAGISEDYVRNILTKTNNIIYKDNLTKIEIFDNFGTEDNSTDKIVHVYFKPLSIWDEKEVVSQSSEKAVKSMKVLFANPSITHIIFWTLGDFTDSYGNSNESTALRIGLKSTTASKLNWDNFIPMVEVDYKKLFDIADDKYVHPSIATALNWDWR